MLEHQRPLNLSEVLDRVLSETTGERVSLGEILQIFGLSAYGPALLAVALISMLPPISMLPGLPMVTGTLFLVLSAQLLVLRRYPWLPRRIRQFSLSRDKVAKTIQRARPWALRLNRLVGPRLPFLLQPPFLNGIALICLFLALLTFPLAILPGGENVPAAAVFFFGLALTARDGLLALIGLVISGASVAVTVYFWPLLVETTVELWHMLGW